MLPVCQDNNSAESAIPIVLTIEAKFILGWLFSIFFVKPTNFYLPIIE